MSNPDSIKYKLKQLAIQVNKPYHPLNDVVILENEWMKNWSNKEQR